MAYNVELRKNDGSAFTDLYYPKTTWTQVQDKPSTFTPTAHTHDDRYFTETEITAKINLIAMESGVWHHFTDPNTEESGFIDGSWVNKFAFWPRANLLTETSSNGSVFTTTTEYSDDNLAKMTGGNNGAYIPIPNLGTTGEGWKRFTFTTRAYVSLSMLYLWTTKVTGTLEVKVEKRVADTQAWEIVEDYTAIDGWPSHHTLRHSTIWFQTSGSGKYDQVRVTFHGITTNTSYINHNVYFLQWWGGYPASYREIYHTDQNGVVTFPTTLKVGSNAVILEGDSRLTNSRPASDVYAWAKAASKPAYTFSEIGSKPTTLSGYGITDGEPLHTPGTALQYWKGDKSLGTMPTSLPASDVYAWAKKSVLDPADLPSGYGDTKNPYASKTAKYILAAPNEVAGVPNFRLLSLSDIPDLASLYAALSHVHASTDISGMTANRVMVSSSGGLATVSVITTTELNALDNISDNIQDQFNARPILSKLVTTANVSTSLTVLTSIAGLDFEVFEGKTYHVRFYGVATTSVSTTGIKIGFKSDTASAANFMGSIHAHLAGAGYVSYSTQDYVSWLNGVITTTGTTSSVTFTSSTPAGNLIVIDALITVSADCILTVAFGSEVDASTVTILTGATLLIEEV